MSHWTFILALTCASGFAAILLLGYFGFSLYRQRFYKIIDMGANTLIIPVSPLKALLLHAGLTLLLVISLGLWINPVVSLIVGIGLLFLPKLALKLLCRRREKKFAEQLPDTLSAVSASLKSGLNLTRALDQVVKNQPSPISSEFSQVLAEYRMGRDLQEALDDLETRLNLPELAMMNTAISISRSVGGNLGETLEALAETLRQKARVEGRIQALTAMGRAQGWLAGVFPLVIGYAFYMQEPEAMSCLFTEPLGWGVLALIVLLLIGSSWMIRKIITIDV